MSQSSTKIRQTTEHAKYVCLFGIGQLLADCYRQLSLIIGREPDFLCDNAPEKWGELFFSTKCISPLQLADLHEETVVIITIKNYELVYRQLSEMGCNKVFIVCYDRCYNTVADLKRIDTTDAELSFRSSSAISVKDRWTFITGAARGVGREIAIQMAMLGSNIIAHSRSISHTEEIGDICASSGVRFIPVAAEFSNLVELETILDQLIFLVPQIDIVFNNAGISPPCPSEFWNSSPDDYIDSYKVNTVAPIRICQRLIPPMIKRGFGRVINITSSIQKRPAEMAYACSKSALNKFVHDLAPSLQGTGVMMSLLDPGWLRTDMGGAVAPNPVESVVPGVLLGALLDCDINGHWIDAQEYAGLDLPTAMRKAGFYHIAKKED